MWENLLPLEVWLVVLSYLEHRDLARLCLVNRSFYHLASCPHLWRRVRIRSAKVEEDGIKSLLGCHRLRLLNVLDLSYLNLASESGGDIVRLLARLQSLRLRYSLLSDKQKCLLLSCLPKTPGLTSLDLDSLPLSGVPARIFSSALPNSNLSSLNLSNTGLNNHQICRILSHLPPTLKGGDLTLGSLNLEEVSLPLLQSVVCSVSSLSLPYSQVSPQQLTSLLWLTLWSPSISSLELTGQNINAVEPQLLADAASCLDSLNLSSCLLSGKHLSSLLYSLRQDCSTLDTLSLACVDITHVNGGLLVKSFSSLSSLSLSYSKLSPEQATAVVRSLAKATQLTRLELAGLDLRQVSSTDLARLVVFPSELCELNLNHTKLSPLQTCELLTSASSTRSRLRVLGLTRADISMVPTNVLKTALKRIKMNLSFAKLSPKQKPLLMSECK